MRYQGLTNILNLAIRMQGLHSGMTLDDIRAEFGVSRRTAERMRDAVERAFGPLDIADSNDDRRHWRLRSDALRRLVRISADDLADLSAAVDILDNRGFGERASALRNSCSTPASPQRRMPTAHSRYASPLAVSTRCAGTSSPGARTSGSMNPIFCAAASPRCAPHSEYIETHLGGGAIMAVESG